MFKKILLFIFVLQIYPLQAQLSLKKLQEQLSLKNISAGRTFNVEAARLTASPRFAPLMAIPIVPFKLYVYELKDGKKNRKLGYGGVSGLIGVDWHYYAPNSRLTFGGYTDFVQQQLTIQDEIYPTFTTNELHLSPYFHLKTGGFDEWFHIDFNIGATFIGVLSHHAQYYDAGKPLENKEIMAINKLRIEPYAGGGITMDLTEMDKNVNETFFASRIRLITANFQLHLPIPYLNNSNIFRETKIKNNNVLDRYQIYRATRGYLTFTLGAKMDLRDYIYKDSYTNPLINNTKSAFVYPPHYFKEPIYNNFGGFHIDMSYQPALDTLTYSDNQITARHAFRNGLNYCIGYNYHFGGNYESTLSKSKPLNGDFFGGIQITNRNYIPINRLPERYHTTSLGIDLGLRGGWNGIYASLSGEIDYNFINQKIINGDGVATNVKLLKPYTYNGVLGLSWRNIIQFKVKRNPFFTVTQGISDVQQLEYWLSVGF